MTTTAAQRLEAARRGWRCLAGLLAIALTGSASAQAPPPRNHALVIGIDQYLAAGSIGTLKHAVADAKEVARVLGENSYEVVPLIADKARRENIVMELGRLAATAREEDSVLIYFAGHGVRRKLQKSSSTYWLTYDASMSSIDVNGIRVTHLLDYVNEIPARRKILILDHCYSAEVDLVQAALGTRAGEETAIRTLYAYDEAAFKAQVESRVPAGLVVISAATDTAHEFKDLGHGIFTYHLLRAFDSEEADENKDNQVSTQELQRYMKKQVEPEARKRGVIQDVVSIQRGTDLEWPIVKLSRSTAPLRQMLSRLQQEANLDLKVLIRSLQSLDAADDGVKRGDPVPAGDKELVELLRRLHAMGSAAPPRQKVQVLQGWFEAKGLQ